MSKKRGAATAQVLGIGTVPGLSSVLGGGEDLTQRPWHREDEAGVGRVGGLLGPLALFDDPEEERLGQRPLGIDQPAEAGEVVADRRLGGQPGGDVVGGRPCGGPLQWPRRLAAIVALAAKRL